MSPPSSSPPSRALVLLAHPRPHLSRVNVPLAKAARALPGVEVRDLYDTYPDFYIDVAAEQASVERADIVVFLHPIQWYSMPSLLKEWVDTVLLPGWAYGEHGHALAGKTYWLVATTGSPGDAYGADGLHGRPLDDFLHAFRQTAQLCGMHWAEPLILHGAHHIEAAAIAAHQHAFVTRLGDLLQRTPTSSRSDADGT
jgi:glutathione-regulated potassium-efflux system ancillary protein KefF